MTARPRVHVLDPIHPEALDRLAEEAEVLRPETPFPAPCDAVILRTHAMGAAEIGRCPGLRVIGKHGAGLDSIDLQAARARGIEVLSTPGANAEAVADLAVGHALALLRGIHTATLTMKAGRTVPPGQRQGFDLAELRAGILGLGATGSRTARRLTAGFGARVQAFDPLIPDKDWPAEVERLPSAAALFESSQILFVHAPLLPETRNILDRAALASMPRGAYLVNCARGGLVDETALAEALESGALAGAASDVFAQEPPAADNPLLRMPGFLCTPHVGGSTNGALRRVGLSIAEQVLDRLRPSPASAPGDRAPHQPGDLT
jgi:phosphoglycerate dehydrogenase-like enzyme